MQFYKYDTSDLEWKTLIYLVILIINTLIITGPNIELTLKVEEHS